MADPNLDFRPVERRERRRFQPPPWERGVGPTAEETPAEVVAEATPEVEVVADDRTPARAEVDEALVNEMLTGLSAEEPSSGGQFWKASVVVGAGTALVGLVFAIWGVAGLVGARRTGVTGMLGGSVLVLFGVGFVIGGLYFVVKNLRQQGVL